MINLHEISLGRRCLMGTVLLLIAPLFGCAKLPLENTAPDAPVMTSDNILYPAGVEIRVTVEDLDGDMVALEFQATHSTGEVQYFFWTSFIASGKEDAFYLDLSLGQWTIQARAKDELAEISEYSSMDLTVVSP